MNEVDLSELASARGSVDAARLSVNELVQRMDGDSKRRTRVVAGFVGLVAVVLGGSLYLRYEQDLTDCKRSNDARAAIRQMSRDATLEGGEALIDIFPNAPAERVEQYREALDRRLTIVVSRLEDRDC